MNVATTKLIKGGLIHFFLHFE